MNLINAPGAPEAIGPYSHAVDIGKVMFCSGQIPLDPETMKLVDGGIKEQTRQVFRNIRQVLWGSNSSLEQVVKTTIFLADMGDFPVVNEIYADEFGTHKPARSTVAVAGLPLGSLIEIECIATTSIPKRDARAGARSRRRPGGRGPSGSGVRRPRGGGPKTPAAAKGKKQIVAD